MVDSRIYTIFIGNSCRNPYFPFQGRILVYNNDVAERLVQKDDSAFPPGGHHTYWDPSSPEIPFWAVHQLFSYD